MEKMKRILVLAMVVMMCAGVANAEWRFGVKAGVNVDKMHFDNKTFDSDNRAGFTGGIMTEFTVPLIGIGADVSLMYTRMNGRLVDEAIDGSLIETKKEKGRDFLEIPVNLKYKLTIPVVASIIKPYVFTGPDFAFRLSKDTFSDMKTRTCQVAWNLGLGVELLKHLQLSGSYAWGVNNIADHWLNTQNIKVKNNYWTITAAYLF